jgi:hypothetical protein
MRNDNIKIVHWTGRILFHGDCDNPEVEYVLDANRCQTCKDFAALDSDCPACDGSGYNSYLYIEWENVLDDRNVYEWVHY